MAWGRNDNPNLCPLQKGEKLMSQKGDLLEYLKAGNTLTGLDGLKLFGSMSIRNRISELRAEGHNIKDALIRGENGKRYCKYWLETRKEEQLAFMR